MEQLRAQGWDEGDNEVLMLELGQTPADSYRQSFREVVLMPKLKAAADRWGQTVRVAGRSPSWGKGLSNGRST